MLSTNIKIKFKYLDISARKMSFAVAVRVLLFYIESPESLRTKIYLN